MSNREPHRESFQKRRSVLLDCIRAFAVFAVVVYHLADRYDSASLGAVAELFRNYGHYGVDIFFSLSGYLITLFLLGADTGDKIRTFFLRRFFRILPLYFVAVTLYLASSLLFSLDEDVLSRIWRTYAFLTGWFIFFEGDFQPYKITWSLSIEEFAYIIFGLATWFRPRLLVHFLVACIAGSFVLRLNLQLAGYQDVHFLPLARLDSIAIGGVVAFLIQRGVRHLTPSLALLTGLSLAASFIWPVLASTLQYVTLAFGTCFFISLFETELHPYRFARIPGLNTASSIGFHSYFIYLFHLFIIDGIGLLLGRFSPQVELPFWPMVIFVMVATQVSAVLSMRYFEGPAMRYGRSLEKKKEPVSTA